MSAAARSAGAVEQAVAVEVFYLCGHRRVERWRGDEIEVRRALAAATQHCPSCCRRAEALPERAVERLLGLPELEGTPGRVSWGSQRRVQFLETALRQLTRQATRRGALEFFEQLYPRGSMLREQLVREFSETSAVYWIELDKPPFMRH